ncbi:hypothetical protein PUN28_008731 [Cardiocondyla obscurior]|uniref:Uncharacterized protein n=1 Tax=Cardiocondyla obscurior TaxID=286306 RepID=A0AAW2G499_9HYME
MYIRYRVILGRYCSPKTIYTNLFDRGSLSPKALRLVHLVRLIKRNIRAIMKRPGEMRYVLIKLRRDIIIARMSRRAIYIPKVNV